MTVTDEPWWRMCPPCAQVRHGACLGGVIWCECVACVMLEAEELAEIPTPRLSDP